MGHATATAVGRWTTTLAVGLCIAWAGCGPRDRATVSGRVSFDGAPIEHGTLELRTPDNTAAVAFAVITRGSFRITRAAHLRPGTYRVIIHAPRKTGKKIPVGSPAPPGTMADEMVESIPGRYNESSELEKVISPGSNTLKLDLAK